MKGNSGIIGYSELNSLTHEAETLLNNVRQGKITPTHELIDLLLLVVDVLEALVQRINIEAGSATPFNISPVVKQLQEAQTGGPISLPQELLDAQANQNGNGDHHDAAESQGDAEQEASEQETPAAPDPHAPVEVVTPTFFAVGAENDDTEAFRVTVRQQFEIIHGPSSCGWFRPLRPICAGPTSCWQPIAQALPCPICMPTRSYFLVALVQPRTCVILLHKVLRHN